MARVVQVMRAMHTPNFRKTVTTVTVSLASAGILSLGCAHDRDARAPESASAREPAGPTYHRQEGVTNTQPRATYADASVVERLSRARCEREEFCDNVGGGKKYTSRQICMDSFRSTIGNDLNSYQCPGGLDDVAIRDCLSAISSEECGAHPLEAITRVDKCRSGAMCKK